jgi:hypothetical protein
MNTLVSVTTAVSGSGAGSDGGICDGVGGIGDAVIARGVPHVLNAAGAPIGTLIICLL